MKLDKMRVVFKKKENILFFCISIISLINSFFLVPLVVTSKNFPIILSFNKIYLGFFLIFILFLGVLYHIFKKPVSAYNIIKKILLTFLPTEITLLFVLHNLNKFTVIPHEDLMGIMTSAYLIAAGLYFIFRYKKYQRLSDFFNDFRDRDGRTARKHEYFQKKISFVSKIPVLNKVIFWFFSQGFWASLAILVVLAFNLGFGTYHLAEFAAVDEPLWTYDRIPGFWKNIRQADFGKTTVSDKPGITVAYISGIGLNWVNPYYYKNAHGTDATAENYLDVQNMNFALRFPQYLFNFMMLLFFYIFIKKLLGKGVALISFILIGLSPLLIGISTIINPDSLLWVFTTLSILGYFIYLREDSTKYLYLSGIFLGLSLLTKYVANILYIFFFGLIFLEYITNKSKYENISISSYFYKSFKDYFIIVFLSLATFLIFLPAVWLDISRILKSTLLSKAFVVVWPIFVGLIALILFDTALNRNRLAAPVLKLLSKLRYFIVAFFNLIFVAFVFITLANTYLGMKFFNFESILASPKSSLSIGGFMGLLFANFYSLIFGIIPVAFISILFLVILNIKNSKKIDDDKIWPLYIVIFILLYYFASAVEGVGAPVRYQIILYPLAFILAAIGIYKFINYAYIKKYFKIEYALILLILASIYSLNFIKPFYFSYASDLLPKQYVLNLKDMGDGSYEAARYLNSLPESEKLVAWTDKKGVCDFFNGMCISGFDFSKDIENINYFVISSGREVRSTHILAPRISSGEFSSLKLDNLYDRNDYDYKLEIGGRPGNFVEIISKDKLLNN